MATNKIGKGTCNIAVNAPKELHLAIGRLAYASDMSMGAYMRMLAAQAVVSGATFDRRKARELVASAARAVAVVAPAIVSILMIPRTLCAPRRIGGMPAAAIA